jgi:glycine cleavage system H protein
MFPSDLKYTKNHEFIRDIGDGTAVVGITSYAQEALGDVVFVDLADVGARFEAGEEFGTVESVKTISEIFMPASGEILAVNEALETHPEFVNEDAFGKGWLIKVKLSDGLPGDLLDAAAYAALVSEESH